MSHRKHASGMRSGDNSAESKAADDNTKAADSATR